MRPLGRAQHKFELDTHRPGHMFEYNINNFDELHVELFTKW